MSLNSETQVYNLALSSIGARSNVSSLTENSREVEICNLWYPIVRDQILSAAHWPEVTKTRELSLLSSEDEDGSWTYGEPKPGYAHAYALPADCLRPRYLARYEDFNVTRYGNEQQAVNTGASPAILTYTSRNSLVSSWSPGLGLAIVKGLAGAICLPLTGKTSRASMLLDQANQIILEARLAAANTNMEHFEHIPESLRVRGYYFPRTQQFFYPYGALLELSNVS